MAANMATGNLLLRCGFYHFRLTVPADIRATFGQREIKVSLGTGNKREASRHAKKLSAGYKQLFQHARNGTMDQKQVEHIRLLMKQYRKYELEFDELQRATCSIDSQEFNEHMVAKLTQYMKARNASVVEGNISAFLSLFGCELPDSHDLSDVIGWEMLKACIDIHKVKSLRAACDYEAEAELVRKLGLHEVDSLLTEMQAKRFGPVRDGSKHSAPDAIAGSGMAPKEDVIAIPSVQEAVTYTAPFGSTPLSEVIELYLREKTAKGRDPRTIERYKNALEWPKFIIGDVPVGSLTRKIALEFIEKLQKMPSRRSIKEEYKSKSLDELLRMDIDQKLTPSGVQIVIERMSGLCAWASRADYMHKNYFEALSIAGGDEGNEIEPFDDEQLKLIFSTDKFAINDDDDPWRYWLPRIALYSGLRIEEISQLTVDDIRKGDGVWYVDVNRAKAYCSKTGEQIQKKRKNDAAERRVPLHDVLLDRLGFLDFVNRRRTEGYARLFPSLKKTSNRYSHYPSRVFSRWKIDIGFPDTNVFHSFRHRFVNDLLLVGADQVKLTMVIGHTPPKIVCPNYSKEKEMTPLSSLKANVVDKFSVDLSLLG